MIFRLAWQFPDHIVLDRPAIERDAVAQLRRAAYDAGWVPDGIPRVQISHHDGLPLVDVVATVPVVEATPCVDCGQAPGWGPGGRRCIGCAVGDAAERARAEKRLAACAELCGTQAGYDRHREAGEKTCTPCRRASSTRRQAHRRKVAA